MDQQARFDFWKVLKQLKSDDEQLKVQLRRVFSSAFERSRREDDLSDPELLRPTIQRSAECLGVTFTESIAKQDLLEFCAVSAPLVRDAWVQHAQGRLAEASMVSSDEWSSKTLAIEEALQRLEQRYPRACRVAELRLFVGLTIDETAKALHLSTRTVRREWRLVREWLREEPKRVGAS